MKRSLTFVCILASGVGATALAQASSTPATPVPSAPVPASATVPAPGPAKIAIIQFQQAVGATNEGQRDFAELRNKFEPKQTQCRSCGGRGLQGDHLGHLYRESCWSCGGSGLEPYSTPFAVV